jgi:crotonobetaine/carnitine-CoA ligase
MASFLMKEPPCERDKEHPLKSVLIVPYSGPALGFHERFGVDVYTIFNMTEISSPIVSGPNPSKPGVAGRPCAGYDIRLVDENDCEVERGRVGELMLRSDAPWAMNHGYYKNPEATARGPGATAGSTPGTPSASTRMGITSTSTA